MLRILLVHKFHKLTGGAEIFYFEVARVLKENGHQVAFFTTDDEENISTGDPVFSVPAPNYSSDGFLKKLYHSTDIFYSGSKKQKMLEAIDEFKPDVIHAFAIHVHLTPSVLEAAKERNVPVVMSCNDYKHICPNYKLFDGDNLCEACKGERFYNAVVKRCCKDSLIFSTASMVESYVHKYKGVYENLVDKYLFASQFMLEKTKQFWVDKDVSYGILKNPFDAKDYQAKYSGDYALYFGRIISEKGVDKILEAAKSTDVPIKIVGDGPDLKALQDLCVTENILNVEFLGAMWGDVLKDVLFNARFVIIPSLWHENFPYVIFQSFACGKPVIGSDRGGIPELIGDDKGIVFEPDNAASLVHAMNELWGNSDKCSEMGTLARHYIEENFSDEIFYKKIIDNYKSVIE
jgi:glycosyltransferase involved in cell wall biosynthesis